MRDNRTEPAPLVLRSLEGGQSVDFDSQERSAWNVVADGCNAALTMLHPAHPERHQFQTMLRECRVAAGQRDVPAQLQIV